MPEATAEKLEVQYVPIKDIVLADYNPRKLTDKEYADLKQSLVGFGFIDPVIINKNTSRAGILVGGHQRVRVWGELGYTHVPAVFVDLPIERERELNIRLNKNNGSWNWDLLESNFGPDELAGWGFTEKDLFGHFKKKTKGDDEAPDVSAGTPKTKPGDTYQLGPHKIMCGDSTKPEDVRRLMEDRKCPCCGEIN